MHDPRAILSMKHVWQERREQGREKSYENISKQSDDCFGHVGLHAVFTRLNAILKIRVFRAIDIRAIWLGNSLEKKVMYSEAF